MKNRMWPLMIVFLLALPAHAQDPQILKTQKDKVSYIIGIDIGKTFKKQGLDVDPDLLSRGMKDSMGDGKYLLNDREIQEIMSALQKQMQATQEEKARTLGEKNKKEGEAFLAANKKKEGVQSLTSGLQYKIIRPGTGKKPRLPDTVTTHYRGTLIDGNEFDSSYRRGKPVTFPVSGVISGWTEALQLMEEGAKWQLFIPPHLAYGERGAGRDVGPNSVLIFEIELLSVQEKKEK